MIYDLLAPFYDAINAEIDYVKWADFIEEIIKKESKSRPELVLDLGCGSGILSVACLLLGADSAVGVDIDALAVKTAKENGRTNGFDEPEFTVLQGSTTDKVTGKYDIIAANIVADLIVKICEDVKKYMNPDAVFITSGIIVPREDDVLAAFASNGLEVIARHESGGWLCFETKVAE